jgi:PRTRC genetic system ThiF family protein
MKSKIHYAPDYLVNPPHMITVNVIGAGGNGSQVVQGLARMNVTLRALGKPGLLVILYDDDKVSEANIGRQLFSQHDVGRYKAEVLISRINQFYGTSWCSRNNRYSKEQSSGSNITISCVDTAKSRLQISEVWNNKKLFQDWEKPYYWLDLGNSNKSGQVILGSSHHVEQPKSKKYKTIKHLPTITEEFDLKNIEDDNEPSCSIAEAIEKQDLFINPIVSYMGLNLLWKLLKEYSITHRGYYINLETGKTNSINL